MAQRVITFIEFTDDLTGKPFAEGEGETVVYAIDGVTYEIDLAGTSAAEFRELLSPYLKASRKATTTTPRRKSRERERNRQIRDWGRTNGFAEQAGRRGRLSSDMVQAYEQAVASGNARA